MKDKVAAFIKSIKPLYPVHEYVLWDLKQDQRINQINYQMWSSLIRKDLAEVMPILEEKFETGELGYSSLEDALKMGWIIHSFHNYLDQVIIKREIEMLIGG